MPTLTAANYPYTPYPTQVPSVQAPQTVQQQTATADAFGGAEGEALGRLGQTLERAGSSLAERVIEQQNLFNVTAAQEAANNFNAGVNNLLYGNPDKPGDVGFIGAQGRTAMDMWPTVRDNLRTLREEQRKVLQNNPQRLRFDNETTDTVNRKLAEAGRHYGNEMNQWNIATAKGTAKLATQDAGRAAAALDPVMFEKATVTGIKALQSSLERAGQTPEQVQAAIGEFKRDSAVDWAESLAVKDPLRAQEFADKNKELLGDKYPSVMASVRVRADERAAESLMNSTKNYGATGALGNPLTPGWEAANITTITAPGGATFRVNKQAASAFQGFVNELEGSGYKIRPEVSGGFNVRNRRGGSGLSEHAYGTSIDINSDVNLYTKDGRKVTDLPPNVEQLAAKHGLVWGGNWKNPVDTMHFQWVGPQGDQIPDPAVVPGYNYGGIRKPGVVATAAAGGFETYHTPEAGVQAIVQNLRKYAAGGVKTAMNPTGAPLDTIRKIVSVWAPPSENTTAALIARAEKTTGFSADQTLNLSDPETMSKMTEAIIKNEQGGKLPVARATIDKVTGNIPQRDLSAQLQAIEASDASREVKNRAIEKAKHEANFAYSTEVHQRQAKKAADDAADDALETEYNKRIAAQDPSISAYGILGDIRWHNPNTAQRMVGFFEASTRPQPDPNTNSRNQAELFRRITLPDGELDKITSRDVLDQARINREINVDTYNELFRTFQKNIPGSSTAEINARTGQIVRAVRPFIRPMHSLGALVEDNSDPTAGQREVAYTQYIMEKARNLIENGKSPSILFQKMIGDKENPEYVGAPSVLEMFKPQESTVKFGAKDTPAQQRAQPDDFSTKEGIRRALAAGRINRAQAIEAAKKLGANLIEDQGVPIR